MAYWDYYRGPEGTIIGIHSPFPYKEPGRRLLTWVETVQNKLEGGLLHYAYMPHLHSLRDLQQCRPRQHVHILLRAHKLWIAGV